MTTVLFEDTGLCYNSKVFTSSGFPKLNAGGMKASWQGLKDSLFVSHQLQKKSTIFELLLIG